MDRTPTSTPGRSGDALVEFARRADEGPFTSLGVIDRMVYDSQDPLIALTAAAAVTSRLQLCTMIVIGPLRIDIGWPLDRRPYDRTFNYSITLGYAF